MSLKGVLSSLTSKNVRILASARLFSSDQGTPEKTGTKVKRTFKTMRGTGDKGTSGLFSGERRWKDDVIFEALGTCDELTCTLGIVREHLESHGLFELVEKITSIQCDVQDIAAHVATPRDCGHERLIDRTNFDQSQLDVIDSWIDEYAQDLPELTQFILPGGGLLAAHVHHSRSVCRRAERRVAAIVREKQADPVVLQYLNRLSDFLFVLARYSCYALRRDEILYKKSRHQITTQESSSSRWKKATPPDQT